VTVADICAAARIAPRTFFRYFPAKEDLLTEPVREMTEQLAGFLAAEPRDLPDDQVLRRSLRRLGEHVLDDRERLARVLVVVAQVTAVRSSPALMLSVQERQLAERLVARRGGAGPADWRTRLLVARAVAAFRIWLDDAMTGEHPDPAGHLDEVLATI
jgi:AcrR family transcriptional regulator